jgi:anhydro-N-acetylmuramic acid kinase
MYSKFINVIGIMSGTSLDGLDMCLVSFDNSEYSNFEIINSKTYNYSSYWSDRLSNAINQKEKELNKLDNEFGKLISDYINKFIVEVGNPKVDLVSSHGHTIFHDPEKGNTKQIGNGEMIF